ncbi:MAG: rRNA maturation RNase YbeY [Candidatus Omnitrophota bacterium]|nr:rRNA maturation RNase YbeY [Candidatus Omnitrophota bacterium]MDZ4241809.1 rRNA maturation RNase YbeY [Candidatus Omnitrophota bacterium]
MALKVEIQNRQTIVRISPARIKALARTALRAEGVKHARLCVVFVDDRAIRILNRRFLKRSYATDVLAFDLTSGDGPLEGEIAVSVQTAVRQARIYRTSLRHELDLYVVHGILHLTGYDDHSPGDIRLMRRREAELTGRPARCDES